MFQIFKLNFSWEMSKKALF